MKRTVLALADVGAVTGLVILGIIGHVNGRPYSFADHLFQFGSLIATVILGLAAAALTIALAIRGER